MPNRPYLSLFAIVGSLLGASVAAGAQAAPASSATMASPAAAMPGAQHHHGGRMGRALRALDLSASQQSQIKTLMTSYRSSRTSATPQTRKQLMAGIENVLTPTQRSQFETAMQHSRHSGNALASPSPGASESPAR